MTNTVKTSFSVLAHTMNRIDISTGVEFAEFLRRLRKGCPAV